MGQDRRWNALTGHLGDVFSVNAQPPLGDARTQFLTWMSQADFEAVGESHNLPALRDLVRAWDRDVRESVKSSSATCLSTRNKSHSSLNVPVFSDAIGGIAMQDCTLRRGPCCQTNVSHGALPCSSVVYDVLTCIVERCTALHCQ